MTQNHNLVRERQAMLAGMTPVLKDGTYFFCSTNDAATVAATATGSLATFREDEGTALVLNEADASKHGFDLSMPMSRIVLEVFSALDGVGLTAAVATALADEGIPCNMIAAYHHDNVFVPKPMARRAISALKDVQRTAAKGTD
jgi:hypothetical protein